MPELNFVLPHWFYWCGLVLFPLMAMLFYRKIKPAEEKPPVSIPLAYFLLVTGGFIGVHRLYLKSRWAIIFIVLFTCILYVNTQIRDARDDLSGANNSITIAEFKLQRAEKDLAQGRQGAEEKKQQAEQRLAETRSAKIIALENSDRWQNISQTLGGLVILLLLIDAFLIPRLVRQRNTIETETHEPEFLCPAVEEEHDDTKEPFLFNRIITHINGLVGEFVAYWSILAVIVYYYEVIARYVFNSPTNWAHEGMFLMFGMQYLLAGGFVLREGAHVRVDVIYMHFSNRVKAIVDIFTSIFFFIFMFTLMFTGWTFFHDSFEVSEVSFTEWGIQYWPIKFALPLGAVLLLMQGVAQLVKDIAVVINPTIAELDTEVRPEG